MPLELPEVTLFAATSVAVDATVAALRRSLEQARFGRAVLFSDRRPNGLGEAGIEWSQIDPLRSKADYSRFMLHALPTKIATSHALCVQWDGFVIDAKAWNPEFLAYDYIGAVWPQFDDGHNVGNGGFSLRSKRLLDAAKNLPYDGSSPEDIVIGRQHRSQLEAKGLRFAPEEIAARFAFERAPRGGAEFGFHGAFNLARLVSADDLFRVLQSLEPQVLTRNEHKELLRWAVGRGYLKIASLLARRIIRQRLKRY